MPDPIRVVVADDSDAVRHRIVHVLTASPGISVAGEAANGKQAIELCQSLRPDVITMDMMMPVMSGLAATEYIMAFCPTPIVIVSGSTNRGEIYRTYEALSAGALEVIEKPRAGEPLESWERRLVDTIRIAARVRVIMHPRGRLRQNWGAASGGSPAPVAVPARPPVLPQVIAIGGSTGGPKALVDLLAALPARYEVPILVVTHISAPFSAGLAEWLRANVPLPVRLAAHHDPVAPGVSIAPADVHLVVENGRLLLTGQPPRHSCRPSVDVLFESTAREYGARAVGVLLTGMGRDGAEGLLAIRRAHGVTVAQDEASCTIFGMPAEAIRIGAAEHVLPPSAIGELLARLGANGRSPALP